jgi:hypothetical protein
MSADDNLEQVRRESGLCGNCLNSRRIASARGAVFLLCQLSATDPRFPKYPRLPVFSCIGYAPSPESPQG